MKIPKEFSSTAERFKPSEAGESVGLFGEKTERLSEMKIPKEFSSTAERFK